MPSPPDPPLPRHGGTLMFATRIYGDPAGGWLDLSTGVNPNSYPAPPIAPEALARLPDPAALARLIAVARAAYRVPDSVDLLAVPGTEIAIRILPMIAPPGKVAIVSPTYGSHAEAWSDREVMTARSVGDIPADAAAVVLVNPNNPDGRLTSRDAIGRLARSALVVIDEAYADAAPETSFIPSMSGTETTVLRSFGKFYGLPGLRLGFVAATPIIAARLAPVLGDWPVSGPSIAIGAAALADDAWRDAMRQQVKTEAEALQGLLVSAGLSVVGGTDLFVLTETDEAHELHRALANHGVWTRAFAGNPRWLRFGLPGATNMERLGAALSAAR